MKDVREFRNSILLLRRVQAGFESGDFGSDVIRKDDPTLPRDIAEFLDQVIVKPERCTERDSNGVRCEDESGKPHECAAPKALAEYLKARGFDRCSSDANPAGDPCELVKGHEGSHRTRTYRY